MDGRGIKQTMNTLNNQIKQTLEGILQYKINKFKIDNISIDGETMAIKIKIDTLSITITQHN